MSCDFKEAKHNEPATKTSKYRLSGRCCFLISHVNILALNLFTALVLLLVVEFIYFHYKLSERRQRLRHCTGAAKPFLILRGP